MTQFNIHSLQETRDLRLQCWSSCPKKFLTCLVHLSFFSIYFSNSQIFLNFPFILLFSHNSSWKLNPLISAETQAFECFDSEQFPFSLIVLVLNFQPESNIERMWTMTSFVILFLICSLPIFQLCGSGSLDNLLLNSSVLSIYHLTFYKFFLDECLNFNIDHIL